MTDAVVIRPKSAKSQKGAFLGKNVRQALKEHCNTKDNRRRERSRANMRNKRRNSGGTGVSTKPGKIVPANTPIDKNGLDYYKKVVETMNNKYKLDAPPGGAAIANRERSRSFGSSFGRSTYTPRDEYYRMSQEEYYRALHEEYHRHRTPYPNTLQEEYYHTSHPDDGFSNYVEYSAWDNSNSNTAWDNHIMDRASDRRAAFCLTTDNTASNYQQRAMQAYGNLKVQTQLQWNSSKAEAIEFCSATGAHYTHIPGIAMVERPTTPTTPTHTFRPGPHDIKEARWRLARLWKKDPLAAGCIQKWIKSTYGVDIVFDFTINAPKTPRGI